MLGVPKLGSFSVFIRGVMDACFIVGFDGFGAGFNHLMIKAMTAANLRGFFCAMALQCYWFPVVWWPRDNLQIWNKSGMAGILAKFKVECFFIDKMIRNFLCDENVK